MATKKFKNTSSALASVWGNVAPSGTGSATVRRASAAGIKVDAPLRPEEIEAQKLVNELEREARAEDAAKDRRNALEKRYDIRTENGQTSASMTDAQFIEILRIKLEDRKKLLSYNNLVIYVGGEHTVFYPRDTDLPDSVKDQAADVLLTPNYLYSAGLRTALSDYRFVRIGNSQKTYGHLVLREDAPRSPIRQTGEVTLYSHFGDLGPLAGNVFQIFNNLSLLHEAIRKVTQENNGPLAITRCFATASGAIEKDRVIAYLTAPHLIDIKQFGDGITYRQTPFVDIREILQRGTDAKRLIYYALTFGFDRLMDDLYGPMPVVLITHEKRSRKSIAALIHPAYIGRLGP